MGIMLIHFVSQQHLWLASFCWKVKQQQQQQKHKQQQQKHKQQHPGRLCILTSAVMAFLKHAGRRQLHNS